MDLFIDTAERILCFWCTGIIGASCIFHIARPYWNKGFITYIPSSLNDNKSIFVGCCCPVGHIIVRVIIFFTLFPYGIFLFILRFFFRIVSFIRTIRIIIDFPCFDLIITVYRGLYFWFCITVIFGSFSGIRMHL